MKTLKFKEMKYTTHREYNMLAMGTFFGYDFFVVSLGSHPCAYIDCGDTPLNSTQMNRIDCHGGITYESNKLNLPMGEIEGNFIGWDYAHYGDYAGYEELYPHDLRVADEKRWTTDEMIHECYYVIDQINDIIRE